MKSNMLQRGLLTVALMGVCSIGAQAADEPKADQDAHPVVVFGTNPAFMGHDFTMEVNCRDPHNKKAACQPNCCLLINRACVVGLSVVGRCRELPHKPLLWKARLRSGCTLHNEKPPKATDRKPGSGYLFEPDDDVDVPVNLASGAGQDPPDAAASQTQEGVISGLDVQKQSNGFRVFAFVTDSSNHEIQVMTSDQRFQTVLEQASGNTTKIQDHKPPVEVTYVRQGGQNVITRLRFLDR